MKQLEGERQLRIGELASQLDLNPKTVRYYEEIGLLPRAERTESRYRLYDRVDQERLRFILKAKAIGLSLNEIKEILGLRDSGEQPCEHVLGLLDQKLVKVEEQLQVLTEFRADLLTIRREAAGHISSDACVCGIIEFHDASDRARPNGNKAKYERIGKKHG